MNKVSVFAVVIVLVVALCACSVPAANTSEREFETAVFFSYIELARLVSHDSEGEYRRLVRHALFNVKTYLGADAVFFHARANFDAFYQSELFESNEYIPMNSENKPSFDALAVFIEEASAEGIKVYAWVNPYRVGQAEKKSAIVARCPYISQDDVVKYSGALYLNPTSNSAVSLVLMGIEEILDRYDVAGILIDDYFYPTTESSFDSDEYDDYLSNGGELPLDDWRRENVTALISGIHDMCDEYGVSFGVSPDASVSRNYESRYADVAAWCNNSLIDYVVPQIYFGFENSSMPFDEVFDEWKAMCAQHETQLYAAVAAYKIGREDRYAGEGENEWVDNTVLLNEQLALVRQTGCGVAYFRYDSLFNPDISVAEAVANTLYELKENP